jgi:16S rRNA (guanine527-N7)-methyltransferase
VSPTLADLLTESRQLGFLGSAPVEDQIRRAAAFAAAVPHDPARALDLGAGGGLPGLVLAATVWPEARWTFVDARAHRSEFLQHAVDELRLDDRVEVVHARAEDVGRIFAHRGDYDLVVARSFAAPPVTVECAAPLLRPGGSLVVSEPPESDPAARWPADGVALAGFGPAEPVVVDGDLLVHLVRLQLTGEVPDRLPRRPGIPAKRPLF